MILKTVLEEDFTDYKLPSICIGFPRCTFKCETECGKQVCHNDTLVTSPDLSISAKKIVEMYIGNVLTHAIIMAGLEPFDTFNDLYKLVSEFRNNTDDEIIIYTGYYKEEINMEVQKLQKFKNIIIKYGRYIPGHQKHFDELLGVFLASDNQYAERIS